MKAKTVYFCSQCGNEFPKWQGQCSFCHSWNTISEQPSNSQQAGKRGTAVAANKPVAIKDVLSDDEIRIVTGIGELDRVLGGGAVKGSLVLVGGSPGIGKSTLLLQICACLTGYMKVLYISGEESVRQLKMRAERLGAVGRELLVLSETNISEILNSVEAVRPDILIVDSIQTLYNESLDSSPGSVGQVKDCTLSLMQLAKSSGTTVFIVGHVNKEGSIAGPKVLEHMVDCVLYFEGEQNLNYRILRAVKNRFGSTNEIGVFEMTDRGLSEVANPSEMLLSGRPQNVPGTCVTCVMEGSRPILAEIQALITPSSYNVPRRNSNGIDYNRAMMLLAVLEKRGGLSIYSSDAYINVIGGLILDEPAADLAVVLAIASGHLDKPVGDDLAAIGEVGLTGEIRAVSRLDQRLSEVSRLGFKRCVVPMHSREKMNVPNGLEVIPVKTVRAAVFAAIGV